MEVPSVTWQEYVEGLVAAEGGWSRLVDLLYERGRGLVELPDDPATVERGLRRLRGRGNQPGGQYGRWLTRFFGVPASIETYARWVGQYHSRFADLPVVLRTAQLRTLDRPPVSESPSAIWVHLGIASVAHRQLDHETLERRLAMARRIAQPSVEAQLELLLFDARLAQDASSSLTAARALLPAATPAERPIYASRVADQETYQLLHPKSGEPALQAALELYGSIPDGPHPFVAFRRHAGLAYVRWQLGEGDVARAHCGMAISAAGDGGYVRLRVMALNLMSHILGEAEDGEFLRRARQLAAALDDEELLGRTQRGGSAMSENVS